MGMNMRTVQFPGVLLARGCHVDVLDVWLAVFTPWKLVNATAEALFPSKEELVAKYLPTRPDVRAAFKWGTHDCAGAFQTRSLPPPPEAPLGSTPACSLCALPQKSWYLFAEAKAIDCLFGQRLYIVGSNFTHISSF